MVEDSQITFENGWTIDTYDRLFAPVATHEEKGIFVEIDREGDLEVTCEADYAGSVSSWIPVAVIERLIEVWKTWR